MDPSSLLGGAPLWSFGATWLLNYLVHSTLLLGAVWLLSRTRFLSPAFLDVFWKAALVGGLVTAGVQTVGMGSEPLGGRWMVGPPVSASVENTFLHEQTGDVPVLFLVSPGEEVPAAPETALSTWLNRVRTGARQGWPQAMLVVWVLGGALCLARLFWLRFRLTRRLRSRTVIEHGSLAELLRRMCITSGFSRSIRLTVSDRVGGPLAWGRSEICLPRRALVDLTTEQQRNVLAHELAHLVRRDPTWRWFGAVMEAVFFFQPLNRAARRGIHESAEYLSDDWAVRMTGQNLVLAKCLVEVAGWLRPLPAPAPVVGMAEQGSPLVRRVERLLRRDSASAGLSARWPVLAALGMVAATAWIAPGFSPENESRRDVLFTAETHPEHPATDWVQDPFLNTDRHRGGRFPIPQTAPFSEDPPSLRPQGPFRVPEPPSEGRVQPAPRVIRWEWREVRRPARVLTRVNHVQVPQDLQRHLAVLERNLSRDLRPQVREWRRLLREELVLEVQISESGLELELAPLEIETVDPERKVLEISTSMEKAREFLRCVRELKGNPQELDRVREEVRRNLKDTRDTRVTFLLI